MARTDRPGERLTQPESITVPSWFGPIRIVPDPDLGQHRPRGRVRGRRRYYRALHRDAAHFAVRPEGWHDYVHWQADWWGMGNLGWKERYEHLAALFVMFRRLLEEAAGWDSPHQLWLQIDAYDSARDAASGYAGYVTRFRVETAFLDR